MSAPDKIFTCEHVGEYGHYFPDAVKAEGEYGGTAVEYTRSDLTGWLDIDEGAKKGNAVLVWWPHWWHDAVPAWWLHNAWHSDKALVSWSEGDPVNEGPLKYQPLPTPPQKDEG